MAWSKSRDVTTEQNYTNTNIFISPMGSGTPMSSAEYNSNFYISGQRTRQVYSDISPSGFISKILPVSAIETTTTRDSIGELCAVVNGGIPLSSTLRLGQSNVHIAGWNVLVTNNVGTNGIHNNVVLDAAPTTGNRFDLVFLEVFLAEFGATSATISNAVNKPSASTIYLYGNTQYGGINATDDIAEIDAEINRRWQIQYRIRVVDNVDLNTYVDGINHTAAVKAWGANPNTQWAGYASGIGSAYTFQNNYNNNNDYGLYVAGDGSTTAKSILGTVDGFVYAIPIAAVARRNSGIYDPSANPFGSGNSSSNGNIASGVSGRPDGLFYDQIDATDIISLRHQCLFDSSISLASLESNNFEKIIRGLTKTVYGSGDGLGSPLASRNTNPLYNQEICPIASVDAGYRGLAQFNFQRRNFSDAAKLQQTEFTFTGGTTPDGVRPSILAAPIAGTAAVSTTSGTLPSGNYSFKITYTNVYGETLPSAESTTYTLSASGNLSVNGPIVQGNASGWNLYVTATPGSGWTKQNTTPVAIGTAYVKSTPLNSGAVPPVINTTSSTLSIVADSTGLVNGTATVICVDGSATPYTGPLYGNNIIVYDAGTFAIVNGTWSGLNTSTAIFTPIGGWGGTTTTNGVVAVVGLSYPAGNGLPLRPNGIVSQVLLQGANSFSMLTFGKSGVASNDNTHLNSPSSVFVDSFGNIFIADTQNHRILKLNSAFVYIAQFGVTGISGSDNTHLYAPTSVVTDVNGNVYISDSLNHRIVKLNSGLAYVTQFGSTAVSGSDTTHVNTPSQLAIDASQTNIYVADTLNARVIRLSLALSFGAVSLSGLTSVYGVAIDSNNNLYVTYNQTVSKYSSVGMLLLTYGTTGTYGNSNYTCSTPKSITTDGNGYVYFCDSANHRIVKLNKNFIYVGHSGVNGMYSTDAGRFNNPAGIAIDSNNQLFIADLNNHRMIRLHQEMGGVDPTTRAFSVMYSGALSDKLKFSYKYKPYQGLVGNQGSNAFAYTLKALTDIKPFVTSCGTGASNANIENDLNGLTVRLPLPATYFGNSTPTNEGEYVQTALSFTGGTVDPSPIVTNLSCSWGGGNAIFQPTTPNGFQSSNYIAGNQVVLAQGTSTVVYPTRGVNSIERFVASSYAYNGGYDYLGFSFAAFSNNIDHTTYGYFLAAASGGGSVLPLVTGEVVLVVVAFRTKSTSAAIYGQPSIASAVDIYKLEERPVIYF